MAKFAESGPNLRRIDRRAMLKLAGWIGAGGLAAAPSVQAASPLASSKAQTYLFFNAVEGALIAAIVSRLIPADPQWPGAYEAGVAEFIDRQLAGAYGAGARQYLQGPWTSGTPQQGYQLPFTPAELYRTGLNRLVEAVAARHNGKGFPDLTPDEQDQILKEMESGRLDLSPIPVQDLFETILSNTLEGFFADPVYGGNRDMVGWRMLGFPGAHAAYAGEVENHGAPYHRAPVSIAMLGDYTRHPKP